MSSFDVEIGPLLDEEGPKYVANDFGRGPSKYGVTLASFKEYKPDATAEDIRLLTTAGATVFYRWWWERWKIGLIEDQRVAHKVFDLGVNQGPPTVHQFLQRAVGVPADGILGPKTAAAVNARDPEMVLAGIRTAGAQHYHELVLRRPEYEPCLEGWLARLKK